MCLFTFAKYFSPQKILFNYIIIRFGVPNQLEFPASYSQENKQTGNSLKHSDLHKHLSQNILIQIIQIWQSSTQKAVESQEK